VLSREFAGIVGFQENGPAKANGCLAAQRWNMPGRTVAVRSMRLVMDMVKILALLMH
jgi:hypothetical protein